MQQVLLAGGPYPADGLVSSLEMCARRGGFVLPSVGQLTLDHLAPLQNFVRENSTISKVSRYNYLLISLNIDFLYESIRIRLVISSTVKAKGSCLIHLARQ